MFVKIESELGGGGLKFVFHGWVRLGEGGVRPEIWLTSWQVGSKGHCRIRHTLGSHIFILGD